MGRTEQRGELGYGFVVVTNRHDYRQPGKRWLFHFGAYGWTRVLVYADSLDDALDEAIDWLVDNAPGHIVDDEVEEEYQRGIAEGLSEEEAMARAEEDTTCGGNAGNRILSYEWTVWEDPTRADLKGLLR